MCSLAARPGVPGAVNEAWFHRKLDYLCRIWEISPVGVVETEYGPVYIAEGYHLTRPDHPGSGWTVLYAVKMRGMCIAQPIYMQTKATPDERKGAAMQKALEYLGSYHGKPLAQRFLDRAS